MITNCLYMDLSSSMLLQCGILNRESENLSVLGHCLFPFFISKGYLGTWFPFSGIRVASIVEKPN